MPRPTPAAVQPCRACGVETAPGSVSYSDRRQVGLPDGSWTYLCAQCVAALRMSKGGSRLTDAELQRQITSGTVAALRRTWP